MRPIQVHKLDLAHLKFLGHLADELQTFEPLFSFDCKWRFCLRKIKQEISWNNDRREWYLYPSENKAMEDTKKRWQYEHTCDLHEHW